MKKRTAFTTLVSHLIIFLIALTSTSARAVPDSINYQGKLTDDSGVSLDGPYSMRFYLFDMETGGSQLWNAPAGEEQSVLVSDGIYNIQLGTFEPLDATIFDTVEVWLEIAIYSSDTTTWETMFPRQRITSTAYAFVAENAETLDGMTAAEFAGTGHDHDTDYVNEGQTGSISATMIQDGATLAEISDDDGTGSGLNADYLDSLSESVFFRLSQSETVTGIPLFYGGRTGSAPPFYVDSTDTIKFLNADMLDGYHSSSFTLTSQDYGRYNISSTLYEGTTSLTNKYVNEGQANSITGTMILDASIKAADLAENSVYASEIASNAVGPSEINFPLSYTGTDSNGGLVSMTNTSNGSGGNYPAAIYGAANGLASTQNVFGVLGSAPALGSTNDAFALLPDATIGVAGASHAGHGVAGTTASHQHAGVYAESTDGYGVFAKRTSLLTTNVAVYGKNEGSGTGVLGDSATGTSAGVLGRTTSSTGIGVRGQASVSTNYGELGKAGIGVEAQGSTYAGKFLGDVVIYNGSNRVALFDVSDYSLHMFKADGTKTIEIDSDYVGDGRIITDELQITGGSDLSEQFDIREINFDILPGMVVSIDPTQPGKLQISSEAYDSKVAGIVSGAGGIKSGMMMGQRDSEADGAHPVALTGRVYCYADTANGPIQPGDLLTTSNHPGYAMKVTEQSKAFGAILGKAMTPLDEGQGLVLVLVSLQ